MIVIFFIVVIILLLYRYWTRNHDYWEKRNVKHDKPLPFFGNHLPNFLLKRNNADIGVAYYKKYRGEKIVGYYRGTKPELFIRDPDIIKRILSKDFEYFPGRGSIANIKKDPLLHNVIFMDGDEWRSSRQRFTPAFSPVKLRAMFHLLVDCAEQLQDTVHKMAATQEEINAYDLLTRFPLQFIGSCGFGVELNTVNAEYSKFLDLAKSFFVQSRLKLFLFVLAELLPAQLFKPKIVAHELEDVIFNMTRRIRAQRNYKPSGRNDIMDVLLEMENEAHLQSHEKDDVMTLNFVAAQLFSILIGGFETTATAISFTLHQLAYHPEIQDRTQQEIDTILSKYDNKFSYECIGEMSMLEMALKESMRLFSPFGGTSRICAKSYTIPGTDVTIDPGVRVNIPIQALHLDAEYFENPHEFRPERFAPGEEAKISHAYWVFGDGPRKCLGMRVAMMVALTGLAAILHRFTVSPGPSSRYQHSIRLSPIPAQVVEGGLPLTFTPRFG